MGRTRKEKNVEVKHYPPYKTGNDVKAKWALRENEHTRDLVERDAPKRLKEMGDLYAESPIYGGKAYEGLYSSWMPDFLEGTRQSTNIAQERQPSSYFDPREHPIIPQIREHDLTERGGPGTLLGNADHDILDYASELDEAEPRRVTGYDNRTYEYYPGPATDPYAQQMIRTLKEGFPAQTISPYAPVLPRFDPVIEGYYKGGIVSLRRK